MLSSIDTKGKQNRLNELIFFHSVLYNLPSVGSVKCFWAHNQIDIRLIVYLLRKLMRGQSQLFSILAIRISIASSAEEE